MCLRLSNSSWTKIGYIKDAFGLKGELVVHLLGADPVWLKKLKELKIISAGSTESEIVYSVLRARVHKDGMVVSLREIVDRTGAEKLIKSEVQISKDLLVSNPGEAIFLDEILGFKVIHFEAGNVGVVIGFGSNGPQDLLVIRDGELEYEVPFIKVFVEKMDFEAKELKMSFPLDLRGLK